MGVSARSRSVNINTRGETILNSWTPMTTLSTAYPDHAICHSQDRQVIENASEKIIDPSIIRAECHNRHFRKSTVAQKQRIVAVLRNLDIWHSMKWIGMGVVVGGNVLLFTTSHWSCVCKSFRNTLYTRGVLHREFLVIAHVHKFVKCTSAKLVLFSMFRVCHPISTKCMV